MNTIEEAYEMAISDLGSELLQLRRRDHDLVRKLDSYLNGTQEWTGEQLLALLEEIRDRLAESVT